MCILFLCKIIKYEIKINGIIYWVCRYERIQNNGLVQVITSLFMCILFLCKIFKYEIKINGIIYWVFNKIK